MLFRSPPTLDASPDHRPATPFDPMIVDGLLTQLDKTVRAVQQYPAMLSRPTVIIVSDDLGNVKHPGDIVNLADKDEAGNYRRTIIKTADPERYGIRVGDYFH